MAKNDSPVISVIVPIYGVEEYISDCIVSIVEQTYTNLEIILVDDKTTDSSGEICDRWAKKDTRITVIHKAKNEGLNMARYSGWKASSGELVTFIDGDDIIDRKYVEALYECLKTTNTDAAAIGYRFFQHNEKPVLQENDDYECKVFSYAEIIEHNATRQQDLTDFHGNLTTVHSKMFKRSIVEKVDWRKSNYSIGEDDFFMLMSYVNCKKVALVYTELYYYRVSPHSISRSKGLNLTYNGEKTSIFTLVENYKELSTKLLGNDFFDETYCRTYNLYLYYINLLFVKYAWTDHEFAMLQDNIAKDIDSILRIKKYKIDRDLLKNVKQSGSVVLLANTVYERDKEIHNIDVELNRFRAHAHNLETELGDLKTELKSHFGIKRSAKLLVGNIKRKATGSEN